MLPMSRIAVGVDIVAVERIAEMAVRWGDRFLLRVYTPDELAYCQGRAASLAARWAAKEATSKALGCGWLDIKWTDVEVTRLANGQPRLLLHGPAHTRAQALGLSQWALSLSHDREYAIAMVVATE